MSSGLYSGVSGLALGSGLYRNVSGLWGGSSGLIDGFGGGSPFPGASLYLDFLTPPLDPRITFSRGTNATLVDSTGRITYAPANLLTYSQEFDNAAWTKSASGGATAPAVTANTTVAPDGTTTADTVVFVAPVSGDRSNIVNTPSITNGVACNGSFYVKADGAGDVGKIIAFRHVGASGYTLVTLTAVWQRVSVTEVAAVGAAFSIDLRPSVGTSSGTVTVNLWGAQLEPVTYQTTPGTYVATTASAYYGPRFDYDPVTLAPRGLLIEEARTNFLRYSSEFDNVVWTNASPSIPTVTVSTTTAPDGTTTADTLTAATGGTSSQTRQIASSTGATGNFTGSIFLKAGTSTRSRMIVVDSTSSFNVIGDFAIAWTGGVASVQSVTLGTASVTAVGNGWYRCALTASAPSANASVALAVFPDILVGTNSVIAWGAQLEAGAFATSYIPTVASTVSRSADVATMTGTNFSSWYNFSEGTYVYEYIRAANTSGVGGRVFASGVGGSNSYGIWVNQNTATQDQLTIRDISGDAVSGVSFNVNSTGVNKGAVAYKVNDFAWASNGGTVATDTTGVVPSLSDQLRIGRAINSDSAYLNGHIRAIAYYNTRLPNTQLQTLTAPSLASPLALDFLSTTYTVGY